MLWNEFIKLNHVSKLSLNEQLRKFNEHIMYEEQVAGSIRNIIAVPVTIINEDIGLTTRLFINGILNQTQTGAGSKSTLLNPGSTFFIILDNIQPYDAIEFTLRNNGSFVFTTNGGDTITSPTFTATASSNYVFRCNGYST
jgi:hypothetical protein